MFKTIMFGRYRLYLMFLFCLHAVICEEEFKIDPSKGVQSNRMLKIIPQVKEGFCSARCAMFQCAPAIVKCQFPTSFCFNMDELVIKGNSLQAGQQVMNSARCIQTGGGMCVRCLKKCEVRPPPLPPLPPPPPPPPPIPPPRPNKRECNQGGSWICVGPGASRKENNQGPPSAGPGASLPDSANMNADAAGIEVGMEASNKQNAAGMDTGNRQDIPGMDANANPELGFNGAGNVPDTSNMDADEMPDAANMDGGDKNPEASMDGENRQETGSIESEKEKEIMKQKNRRLGFSDRQEKIMAQYDEYYGGEEAEYPDKF